MRYSEDTEILSAEDMEKEVVVSLAGAAAEQLVYGTSYLSSTEDFRKAFLMTHSMITELGVYGLDLLCPDRAVRGEIMISQELVDRICSKRAELINRFSERALALLKENEEGFRAIAEALTDRYSLSKEEIEEIYHSVYKDKQVA